MMRVRFLLSLTLAMLLTVGVAYAQRGKVSKKSTTKPTAVTFDAKDMNKDGKLSWEEFQGRETNPAIVAKLKDIFRAMDVNEDGVVTIEKFHAYWTKPMSHDQNQNQNMYQNINKNMNQKIKSKP